MASASGRRAHAAGGNLGGGGEPGLTRASCGSCIITRGCVARQGAAASHAPTAATLAVPPQVSLKLQKRLAASVLGCGLRKVWLDPNEVNDISMANSSESCTPWQQRRLLCSSAGTGCTPWSRWSAACSQARGGGGRRPPPRRSVQAGCGAAVQQCSSGGSREPDTYAQPGL